MNLRPRRARTLGDRRPRRSLSSIAGRSSGTRSHRGGRRAGRRHPGRHPQHRLRDLQPAQPDHQGAGLARGGAGRPGHHRQLGQVGRLEQGQRGAPCRRHRRRLDGRLGRAPGALERLADPGHRHLLAARVGGHRRPGGLADRVGRRPQGQEDRRDQGHRPLLLPAPVAQGGRCHARRRDRRGPPARRRLGRAPERLRRCVGWTRPDHGRRRAGRGDAPVPERRLQQLRLPQRHRVLPHDEARRGPGRRRRLRAGPRVGAGAPRAETARSSPPRPASISAVATKVIAERSNLDVDPVPGRPSARSSRRSARSSWPRAT